METLTINLKDEKKYENTDNIMSIDLREIKPTVNVNLTDFVEIKSKYLRLLKNNWIKYRDDIGDFYSGGFLIDITDEYVTLRNIQQKIFTLERDKHVFYCKNNTENYIAAQEIIIERQKLARERFLFNQEKIKFNHEKKEFFKKLL